MDYAAARRAMIDSQLRTSGVNDAFVLDRMAAVPRENYVPPSAQKVAYTDRAIPLGEGRWLPAPLFHASLLAETDPAFGERALVVDGGSGYLPDLLRPLVAETNVLSIEQAVSGERVAEEFTLLLVDGAVEALPPGLVELLAEDARVGCGLVSRGVTRLAVGRRTGRDVAWLPLAEMGIPHLTQFDRPKAWSF